MNLTHLASFLAVVDTGSFRVASERLNISQPAVSQHIRKLEEDLGVRLIERITGNCCATRQARDFVHHARSLLVVAERARRSLYSGELTVGASSNVGTYLIQPHFRRFLKQSGAVGQLQIDTNPVIARRLRNGEIDVAAMEWWDGDCGQFRCETWRKEDLVLIVGKDHKWANQKTVRPEALIDEPILGGEFGTGTGRVLRDGLGKLADELKVSHTLGSTEAVKQGVKAGLGISLVLRSAVQEELASGTLHEIKLRGARLQKTIFLISPEALPDTALPRRFCDAAIST